MMPTLRILDTGLAPARRNVALTAALTRRHCCGDAPDTLRFHRYPPCVLVGNGQQLSDAVDIAYCKRRGIEIARRVTGGGAVFMSPCMLAWDLVLDRRSHARGLEGLTRRICEAIAAGLIQLGAQARFEPPNAVTVDGAKISGSSGYAEGRSAVLQGTVLIEDDMTEMAAALALPETDMRRRVSCLAASLRSAPALAKVQAALVTSLLTRLQRAPERAQPDEFELSLAKQLLRDEIGTEAFVVGIDPRVVVEAAP